MKTQPTINNYTKMFSDILTNITDALSSVRTTGGDATVLMHALAKGVNAIREEERKKYSQVGIKGSPFTDFVNKFINTIKEVDWGKILPGLGCILGISCSISSLYVENKTVSTILSVIGHILVVSTFGYELYQVFGPFREDSKDAKTQSGVLDLLNTIFTSIWCIWSRDASKSIPAQVVSAIKSFGSLSVPLDILFEKLCGIFNLMFDGLAERFKLDVGSPSLRLKRFVGNCKSLCDKFDGDILVRTYNVAGQIDALISEGEEIVAHHPKTGSFVCGHFLKRLYSIKESFATRKICSNGSRVEPVLVVFRGSPGVSKTGIIQHMSDCTIGEYLKRHKFDEDYKTFLQNPNEYTHNRTAESEYWEGYNYKKIITFFDDLGQARDVAGNPDNEWMNLIRCINEHEFALHMATLNKKADTFFCSKYVFATTNLEKFVIESIISPQALNRRIDFDVIVVPKDEYCTPETRTNAPMKRILDKSKLPKGTVAKTRLDPSVVDFLIDGQVYSFEELRAMIVEEQKRKETFFEEKNISRKEYLDQYMKDLDLISEEDISSRNDPIIVMSPLPKLESQSGVPNLDKLSDPSEISQEIIDVFADTPIVDLQIALDNNIHDVSKTLMGRLFGNPLFKHMMIERIGTELLSNMGRADIDKLVANYFKLVLILAKQQRIENLSVRSVFELSSFLDIKDYAWYITDRSMNELRVLCKRFEENSRKICEEAFGFLEEPWEYIRPITLVVAGAGVLVNNYFIIKMFLKWIWSCFSSDVPAATNSEHMVPSKTMYEVQAIDAFDEHTNRLMTSIMRQNCFALEYDQDGDGKNIIELGQVTFIKTKVAIMPAHFISAIRNRYNKLDDNAKDNCVISLLSAVNRSLDIKFTVADFLSACSCTQQLYNRDIAAVYLPYGRAFRDITEYFYKNADHNQSSYGVSLIQYTDERITTCNVIASTGNFTKYQDSTTGETWEHSKGICYNAPTQKGSCGMLVVDISARFPTRKIIGFHVAGVASRFIGCGAMITQEDIESLTAPFNLYDALPFELHAGEDVKYDKHFIILGTIDKMPGGARESAYKKSPLYGKFGDAKKSLSLLHPKWRNGEFLDPMYKGLSHYGQPDVVINTANMRRIMFSYLNYMNKHSSFHVEKRLMTEDEIVYGIEGDPSFDAMNRQSSMGYPWNLYPRPGFKGKEFIFGKEEKYNITNENYLDFRRIVDQKELDIMQGRRPEFWFVDNLKDEKLKKEKVQLGKTRVFSAANCELVYLSRKYFGAFQRWYIKNAMKNGSAIGVNPYSMDWDVIAKLLMKYGNGPDTKAYGAGDYSKFDASQKSTILWFICDLINTWYGDSPINQLVRHRLWYEVVNSVHIVDYKIVMWTNSLPSGHPLTSIINSIYNNLAMRYAWCRIHNNFEFSTLDFFEQNIYLIVLGDDNLFSVSKAYRDRFNEATIAPYLAELGLTYTSDTKDGLNVALRNLKEVTFLKRSFRFEPVVSRWVAPLDFDTTMQISYFVKKKGVLDLSVIDNLDTTVRELALYGRKVFEETIPLIEDAIKEAKLDASLRTKYWDCALEIALSQLYQF